MTDIQVNYDGPIVKRSEAKSKGMTTYFTGKPCKNGHIDKRWTGSGGCNSCIDRDAVNRRFKEFKKRNPQRVKEIHSNWQKNNKEKVRANTLNQVARRMNAEGGHTADDVSKIYAAQNGLCVYCNADLTLGYHVDHIMPLALGGTNWPSNLQCLCPKCNQTKGSKHPDDWHREIGFSPLDSILDML